MSPRDRRNSRSNPKGCKLSFLLRKLEERGFGPNLNGHLSLFRSECALMTHRISGRVTKMPLGTPIRTTHWHSEAVRRDPGNGRPLAGISRARASPRSLQYAKCVTANSRDCHDLFPSIG